MTHYDLSLEIYRALDSQNRLEAKQELRRIAQAKYDIRDEAARFYSLFQDAAGRSL
ncbi:MAG: hypothetical protein ABSG74_00720 [Candidatus Bathyarchaeia archaeon]